MRLTVLAGVALTAAVSLTAAGCGPASPPAAGGAAASSATASTPARTAPPVGMGSLTSGSSSAASTGVAASAASGASCPGSPAAPVTGAAAGTLTGLQFTSASQGWAVSQDAVLATTDGGARWRPQLSGKLNLTSVDFISGQDGWAVGASTLLATTDGGARWTALPEPCAVIRSVHFISTATGFAVAGGRGLTGPGAGPVIPELGGVVLATTDGGRSWHSLAAPADAQTVCFSDPEHGWLGANGLLYSSADGGRNWAAATSTAAQPSSADAGEPALMSVECASGGTAWALRVGPGAGMSQEPHVGYYAGPSGATAIFAEQYFQGGAKPSAESAGSYAGPFSAISASAAVFVDWCPACGLGTAPWDVAARSGAVLDKEGNVGQVTSPEAASFLSPAAGWVAGSVLQQNAAGRSRTQQRIVATADGGRSWQVQYAGPWSAWTG